MATTSKNIPSSNPNQAKDDAIHGSGPSGNVLITDHTPAFSLGDLLANDLGGSAKRLYSLNDYSAATPTVTGNDFTATTLFGAHVQFEPSTGLYTYQHTAASIAYINGLTVGDIEPVVDVFTYTIRLANGALSTATVRIDLFNANDAALIGDGASDDHAVKEDTDLLAGGYLTITDQDAGQASFHAFSAPTTGHNGLYGDFTVAADGTWSYALDNTNGTVQALAEGAPLTDHIVVQSIDGTAHTINVTITGTLEAADLPVKNLFVDDPSVSREWFYGTNGEIDIFVFDAASLKQGDQLAFLENFVAGEDLIFLENMDGREAAVGNINNSGFNLVMFDGSGSGAHILVFGVGDSYEHDHAIVHQMVQPFDGGFVFY